MENILENLNDEQKKAVQITNGPLLVIAGAGSGKTKVITHRIAYLISKGILPENILAITFTNKAAQEMRQRILKILGNNFFAFPFISTFHSLGVSILREDGEKIGVNKRFGIIDEDDTLKIIKEVLKDLNLKEESFSPSRVKSFISNEKNKLREAEDLLNEAAEYFPKIMAEVWHRYEEKLKAVSSLDFDDLIVKTIFLFRNFPETLAKYQNRWKYLHIDEYQDTNYSQYILSKFLAASHNNICAVGDSDQAIYSFRGADFTNILNFDKDFQNTEVITLNKNYRSTKNILDTANSLISFNKVRYPKNLSSVKSSGSRPVLFTAGNEMEEGEFVVNAIKSLINEDKTKNFAVLLRANFQSRIFEEFFLREEISYEMVGTRFYDRKEVKDVLAYLKFSLNRNDFLSFGRIVSAAPRGIGKKTLLKYFKKEEGIQKQKKQELVRLENFADEILNLIKTYNPSDVIKSVFKKSGHEDYLLSLGEEGERRIQNVMELASLAKKYDDFENKEEGILKLLEESVLASSQDEIKDIKKNVKIITAHAAKGLEFDTVFVAGLEEGLFPYESINDINREMKIEEERRLFYVACTRARENLFLSCAKIRTIFGDKKINKPSRFLKEIKDNITII